MGVSEAPLATAAPEYPQPIDPTMTIIGVGIAIIIAVAVATLLILRKSSYATNQTTLSPLFIASLMNPVNSRKSVDFDHFTGETLEKLLSICRP
jgi:membrane-anchored protein YejM (alkaline phosphatase superfamily)